ncbi:MAG: DNA repair protein RecO [Pseudomonadales bacterium]|nr:DNA repair protein RecO [Pseudomonadales bacterium]
MRETRQISYVLHTRAYQESSLLVEFFTRSFGRVGVVAKSVRKAKPRFELTPFVRFEISWSGKTQLKTLSACESLEYHGLSGKVLFSAIYINEVLMRLLHPYDPHPVLFDGYQYALEQLQDCAGFEVEICLREFEKMLLRETGYEVVFDQDVQGECMIEPDSLYRYFPGKGFSRSEEENLPALYSGKNLLQIAKSDYSDRQTRKAAKQIMRAALQPHLGNRPLHSRALFVSSNFRNDGEK